MEETCRARAPQDRASDGFIRNARPPSIEYLGPLRAIKPNMTAIMQIGTTEMRPGFCLGKSIGLTYRKIFINLSKR